eukprot:957-Eustigmatos_ZCMA.PRE.1
MALRTPRRKPALSGLPSRTSAVKPCESTSCTSAQAPCCFSAVPAWWIFLAKARACRRCAWGDK